ncbi:hypothetical protein COLO4_08105 [Corchorus olitorius]|uniref:Pentatricopeptide repeat-containing protein n=1 Tax=Corchorus olitorius TaxID=93759 RepID=A0A1R3KHB7_9ROSI|nr:hypothetical protein COLO4_08105 [Corchorus olitorius]
MAHSLITMYARCGELDSARKVFDEISERDLVSWNSMISGCSRMGYASEAVWLFGKMREEGIVPDEMTLVSLLGACGDLGDINLGSVGIWYPQGGSLMECRGRMQSPGNVMITGYAQNGMSDEAIKLFHGMKDAGVNPDKITLVGVLSGCASIGALDLGKWIDTYASQRGLQHDIFVSTALVDMYAKCGSLEEAKKLFENMPVKNEVSWNAMISGLAFHGQPREALSLFEHMSTETEGRDVCPNDVTFVGVISACVHAGLVDEGWRYFDLMNSSYRLRPKIEHYSCMVDLLARAGQLYEAWDFIERIPEKPDEIVLGSLLGGCQKRKNLEVGERVMQLLLKWNLKILETIWIEIEAQLHEFLAGDDLQCHSLEIHQVFDLLNEEMKREGYIPKVDCL